MTSPISASDREYKSFELLVKPIQRWVWKQKWETLRDIQERAIPYLINGDDDLIISAATAGGKTEAAFLPLISRAYTTQKGKGFDLVYVGPLRALINDQFQRLEDLCETLEMPVHPWHGNISQSVKVRARKNPRGILLITPESLEAMFVLRGAEVPRLFAGTQAIVIDELHALLDSERGIHLRSLLTRLELSVGRRIRRVGLSATLGDMTLANVYLRPEDPEKVGQLVSRSDGQEPHVQLRAYTFRRRAEQPGTRDVAPDGNDAHYLSAKRAVAEHIFDKFHGSNNLVFANSRKNVEDYSDLLRRMSGKTHLPNEFFPHHASLSREHRSHVEKQLKEGRQPVTAICTSTLELGIDIGDIKRVGQIGSPWSVAALKQRLGRSGRRPGERSKLRMYSIEPDTEGDSHPVDTLHLGLVRSIAMIELLIEGWCEPPKEEALHLSTLTHQILSVIAERGGASAERLFTTLCRRGPFRSVDRALFGQLLRRLGNPKIELIEQHLDGTLLLGRKGERIVEHYKFYAVFQTPQEYRVVYEAKTLGTIPIDTPIATDQEIIFVGKRWRILEIHDRKRVIVVVPSHAGKPPSFGGDLGEVHETVIRRMCQVLLDDNMLHYLNDVAQEVLSNARYAYRQSRLDDRPILQYDIDKYLLAPWTGTVGITSLAIVLTCLDYKVTKFDGILDVSSPGFHFKRLVQQLEEIATGKVDLPNLIRGRTKALISEKFHIYLGVDLLVADAMSSRLDLSKVPEIAQDLCSRV